MRSFVFNPLSGQFDIISEIALANVGSTPNAKGASLSASQVLTLQPADATFYGLMSPNDWIVINGGSPNTFAGYNSSGVLGTIPSWQWNSTYFGANVYLTVDPPASGYTTYNYLNLSVLPTQASPNTSNINLQLGIDLDPNNAGFALGTNGLVSKNLDLFVSHRGSGQVGNITAIGTNMSLGDALVTGGSATGLNILDLNAGLQSGYTLGPNGIRPVNVNINLAAGSTATGGLQGYSLVTDIYGDFDNYINGYWMGGTFSPSNAFTGGITGFQFNTNVATQVNYSQAFSDNMQLPSGGTITGNHNSFNANPNFQSGSSINSYTGLNVNIPSGPTYGNNIQGINVNTNGVVTSSGAPIAAINSNGLHNMYANVEPPNGYSGFLQVNTFGGNLHITPGNPLNNSFGFIDNLAGTILFEDDIGPDPSGLGLGIATVGFVGQISGVPGKTVDTINYCVGGASVPAPSTGGTVTNINIFSALGILPSGGSLAIDNLIAFKVGSAFSSMSPTNAWGLYVDDSAIENYMAKSLAIGTTSKKVGASTTGLEVYNKDVVIDGASGGLTITKFNANGVLVNNSSGVVSSVAPGTTGNVLTSNGTSWVSAPNSGGSPITTKGDIIVGDSTGTPIRLPIGTDNLVLTPDSSDTNGVGWRSPIPTNYVKNPTFESGNVTGWSLFNTTITSFLPNGSVIPGSNQLLLSTTTTNPLRQGYSMQVGADPAASTPKWAAGHGVISDAFTLDRADAAKTLTITFEYQKVLGITGTDFNGVLGTQVLIPYIYNATTNVWIQPTNFLTINSPNLPGKVVATFSAPGTPYNQQLRFAILASVDSTSSNLTVNFDSIKISNETAAASSSSTFNYFQGYMPAGSVWSDGTTGSFNTLSITSGLNTLTTRRSNGITVTAAALDAPAIVFTPSSNTAVYIITARFGAYNNVVAQEAAFQLSDGTNIIATGSIQSNTSAANTVPNMHLYGIYVPGTTSPVTISLQSRVSGGAAYVLDSFSLNPSIEWTITQMAG